MTSTPELGRRQALLDAKLRGLARAREGDAVDHGPTGAVPGGSALMVGETAWVLAEDHPGRSLGPALAWASRRGATRVVLVASAMAGDLARQASFFTTPVEVVSANGRDLEAAVPSSQDAEPPLAPGARAFEAGIVDAGAEPIVEGGRLLAEVKGLEVGRVSVGADGEPMLEVGVGKHDREAHQMVGFADPLARLFEVVRTVVEHRVPDGEGHAAYHLSTERWLRWVLLRHPAEVGAQGLHAVPSPVVRTDLRQAAPAPAAGVGVDGESVLVVCSAGIDLNVVPVSVDVWQADGRKPRLVIAVPDGDDHAVTRDLASLLSINADVVAVRPDWRAL